MPGRKISAIMVVICANKLYQSSEFACTSNRKSNQLHANTRRNRPEQAFRSSTAMRGHFKKEDKKKRKRL